MAEERIVRGLLGEMGTKSEGVAWASEPTMPLGTGLGASPDAVRWARLGRDYERWMQLEAELAKFKKGPGRPAEGVTVDVRRAVALWWFAHGLAAHIRGEPRDSTKPAKITARELIRLAQIISADPALFPYRDNTIEQSVSRGKKALGIDRHWLSETCDKLAADCPQTT